MTELEKDSRFQRDVRAYLEALPDLLSAGEGQFVLICNGRILSGMHPSYEAAMAFGHSEHAGQFFMAKQVDRADAPAAETCPS